MLASSISARRKNTHAIRQILLTDARVEAAQMTTKILTGDVMCRCKAAKTNKTPTGDVSSITESLLCIYTSLLFASNVVGTDLASPM
jgi:hypothetical protein